MEMLGIGLDLMSILVTFVILVGVLLGKKDVMNEYFPMMLLMNALTLMANMGTLAFKGYPEELTLLKVSWILEISFALIDVAGFNLYVDHLIRRASRKHMMYRVIPFIIVLIVIVLSIISIETGWVIQVEEEGYITLGKYYLITIGVGIAVAAFDLYQVMRSHIKKEIQNTTAIGLYLFVGVPLLALLARELIGSQSLLFTAMTVSYLIMYIMIHTKQEERVVAEKAEDAVMHTELTISQIQPHFIFNSLTAIKYLCRSDAKLAEEAIGKFSVYLRRNLDYLEDLDSLVDFEDEIEHTQNYMWLEQLRFGKKLKIDYSIDVNDFKVPPLCIQPIVENAVKHGITKKVGGGEIQLQVREQPEGYKITISDNGVGFDTTRMSRDEDGELHKFSGINNVRRRLSRIKGSTFTVTSSVGVGTVATYFIKKDDL